MKRMLLTGMSLMLLLTGCGSAASGKKTALGVILLAAALALIGCAAVHYIQLEQHRRQIRREKPHRRVQRGIDGMTGLLAILAGVFLLAGMLVLVGRSKAGADSQGTLQTTEPPATEAPLFEPQKTAASDPDNWGIRWEVLQGQTVLQNYRREESIRFENPQRYFSLPGICTFRGDPLRSGATYGYADLGKTQLQTAWTFETGALDGGTWTGSGWTGQPLMVQWDAETRQNMNLYPGKKEKADLVEVIYATLDGHIYFLDLEDGSPTRDPMNIGLCFKGAGALDPRGYPLLYVGAGDVNVAGERPRMFIISLIDTTILYEYGHEETMAFRTDHDGWCAFDSSPLVDADTDTLIWPGENGLLYTIRLNSVYDKAVGTVRVSPETPVAARYRTNRSGADTYWYGFEASAAIYDRYLYVSENGGLFYCVDLDTMELVWAQDTEDDSNSSPVFEETAEGCYLYTAPSLHWTADAAAAGMISIFKLDALTGEIIWKKPYDVNTVSGVSGGVQSTPLLGRPGTVLDGLILYTIARTPNVSDGVLVALDTATGNEVWRMDMAYYAWSSPVAFYGGDGGVDVAVCDSNGNVFLLDGAAGQVIDACSIGTLVEASPAVYQDRLVVGTRDKQICCLQLG